MKNTLQRYGLFLYLQVLITKKGVEKTRFMFLLHLFVLAIQKLLTTVGKMPIPRRGPIL